MKGLILAAGSGTRLRPFTHTHPKHLLPVGGKAIIAYGIDAMAAVGIRDVGIVVGAETEGPLRDYLGDGACFGVRLSYVFQPQPKGLAHAVMCAERFLDGEAFVLYLGDNLMEDTLAGMLAAFHELTEGAVIALKQVPNPSDYGVAALDGQGRILRLVEKPAQPPSDLAVVGVYVFSRDILDACRRVQPSGRGELEITDAIQLMVDDGRPVLAHRLQGWWKDTGKPRHLIEANALILDQMGLSLRGKLEGTEVEGTVIVEPGAHIARSTLRGPVYVGPDAVVTDSHIGPYVSLGRCVHVEHACLEHSILMDEAIVRGAVALSWSVLGCRARVLADELAPPLSLLLGDDGETRVRRAAAREAT